MSSLPSNENQFKEKALKGWVLCLSAPVSFHTAHDDFTDISSPWPRVITPSTATHTAPSLKVCDQGERQTFWSCVLKWVECVKAGEKNKDERRQCACSCFVCHCVCGGVLRIRAGFVIQMLFPQFSACMGGGVGCDVTVCAAPFEHPRDRSHTRLSKPRCTSSH